MVHPVTAQVALDEARRRLDIQLDTIESIRNRGLAILGVAGIVGSMAGLPSKGWQVGVLVVLSAGALGVLYDLLRSRKLRGPVNPLDILDDPDWIAATDEAYILGSLARRLAKRHDEQIKTIDRLLDLYRALLILSFVLIVLFITWGGTS